MEAIRVAFSGVFPLTIYLLSGVLVRKMNWMTASSLNQLNRLMFRLFLPLMLFINIVNSQLESSISLKLLLFPSIAISITFLIAWFAYARSSYQHDQKV